MDTIVSTENSKRQKLFEVQNNVEIEDRISFLPEHILQYILSFLPTKYAVGTSVLSTRWKFLWTLVQNLDFFDELVFNTSSKSKNYSKRKRFFINFVERVFLLNDVSDIQKFSLKCKGCTAAQFDKWISTVVRRKVQELVLCISKSLPFMLPGCIFTCQSLRILKIEMEVSVNIPALICFPCLNYLHLGYRIIIFSEPLVQEVSISCPVLEEFVMIGCKWMKFKTVNITVPKLQRLTIQDWYHKGLFDCEIMISAESLKSFRFRSDLSYAYSLCHLSSLVEAIIDIGALYTTPDDKIVNRVSALVRGICNARDIELTADSTVTLSLPVFSADLHSLSRMINFKVAQGSPTNGRKLIDLLCNTPNIEFMSFPNGIDLFGFTGHGRILGKTPRCFLPNLKLVDIGCFRGIREEQWFVKFLVKSVSVMDKLTIKLPRCDRWVVEQLEMIVKDSKCVLEFV